MSKHCLESLLGRTLRTRDVAGRRMLACFPARHEPWDWPLAPSTAATYPLTLRSGETQRQTYLVNMTEGQRSPCCSSVQKAPFCSLFAVGVAGLELCLLSWLQSWADSGRSFILIGQQSCLLRKACLLGLGVLTDAQIKPLRFSWLLHPDFAFFLIKNPSTKNTGQRRQVPCTLIAATAWLSP